MPKLVTCLQCRRKLPIQYGDLFCSPKCRKENAAAKVEVEHTLALQGFEPVKGILNLWVKDGVHLTTDQVMHEGLAISTEKHAEAVAAIG